MINKCHWIDNLFSQTNPMTQTTTTQTQQLTNPHPQPIIHFYVETFVHSFETRSLNFAITIIQTCFMHFQVNPHFPMFSYGIISCFITEINLKTH